MKVKAFLTGTLTGILLATTVSVSGENSVIEAIIGNYFKINIDGTTLDLPDGTDILLYNGKTYTPVRDVAEAMGAKVDFEEATKTVQITSPPPIIHEVIREVEVIKEIEVIKEVEVVKEVSPEGVFNKLPVRLQRNGVMIDIFGVAPLNNRTLVYFDLKNDSGDFIILDAQKAYITIEGDIYDIGNHVANDVWLNSVPVNSDLRDRVLSFEAIPGGVRRISVSIPARINLNPYGDRNWVDTIFNMNIDLTE